MVRWTSNSASIEQYIPHKGPNSSSRSNCTTDQPHAPHFPAVPRREPSVATWPLNPSAGAPALMLFRLQLFPTEMIPVPLAFTERMRNNASLPLPLLLRSSRFVLPLSESLWDLTSDLVPFWAMVEPELFCAFLFVTCLALTFI